MKKIGMGLIGPGFVAAHHVDAVRRLGDVDVVAIAGSSQESADKKAKEYKVERAYGDFHALIADPEVQVIHNTTPNYLHLPVTMAALQAGKHVISDKPLAMNPEEGRKLRDAAAAAKVGNVVTFNYRGSWGSPGVFRFSQALEDAGAVLAYLDARNEREIVVNWRRARGVTAVAPPDSV